jgi:hypothetical protein
MTGYPVERLPAPGVPLGARLVSKPIVMQALLDTVGTALGLPAESRVAPTLCTVCETKRPKYDRS